MSFVYSRIIAITRPRINGSAGVQPYGGVSAANEEPVASGIAASIQLARVGGASAIPLPADVPHSRWRILFRAPRNLVQERDIITDDEGVRYQVAAAAWSVLGCACECERLEV